MTDLKIPTTDEEMRPIAVHVEKITYDVSLSHAHRRRIAVIDLEMSYPLIEQLIENLQKMSETKKLRGTVRVRFKGTMVLE